jgi:hypothetical protein
MTLDGGVVIVLVYLLVSVGVIAALVLTVGGGLDWLRERRRQRERPPPEG